MKQRKMKKTPKYISPSISYKKIVFKNILFNANGFDYENWGNNPSGSEISTWVGSCGSGTATCAWIG